jgi:hypothetical protein
VWTAAAALVALAIVGAYQGWQRSAADADVAGSTDGLLPVTNAVSARQASALAEPPPPVLTEAQIRTIARQEAQAALTRPATGPSEPSGPAAPTPSRPSAPPVDRPAPTPAPAPAAEGGNPPLF